ncbi:MAG: ImmA/IrrE family metallo-endopeptidase [Rhizomicrobium sp.]|nr:ImmA/IrrE family metallo-endopeptidase [Rhizomicrobium sp.]
MDEFTAVSRAREFVRNIDSDAVPVPIEAYAESVGAKIKYDSNMRPGEDGCSTLFKGKLIIAVNARDIPQRQRFTVCHEIAHAVLGLPSEHGANSWSYAKRPLNEILCDVFAAELLLPVDKFKPLVDDDEPGFRTISSLAETFQASLASTASRFATVSNMPCAYVLSEAGKVKYSARSRAFREMNGWVVQGAQLPSESMANRLRDGGRVGEPEEMEADVWLSNWTRGGVLVEDSRHMATWDQTLSLIWFEDGGLRTEAPDRRMTFERDGLNELDGVLSWPGKKRRR